MRRAAALASLLVAACGGGGSSPAPKFTPFSTDGARMVDADGSTVILRGVNARVDGVFDVTFSDGRLPLEPIPALDAADCARMHELGIDVLRLPISWSALEPVQDQFDDAYLAKVDAAVQCLGGAGVYVVIDMHQDAYSKEIGEDGAPRWAIVPAPTMLLGGPLGDLGARRTSAQVLSAFTSLFDPTDAAGLQAALSVAWSRVAARFASEPMVIGFEVYNEPDPVLDDHDVDAFNAKLGAVIRAAAPAKLVFFEPNAVRNLFDFVPLSGAPFPVGGAVYAPHVYTYVFSDPTNHLSMITIDDLRGSVDNASAEAASWHTPLFIGEYGLGPQSASFAQWMNAELDLQDEYFASSAFWVWKEDSQASWGLFDHDAMTGAWTERAAAVDVISRPHAQRIAGTPTKLAWDRAANTFTIAYDHAVDAPNLVYVPSRLVVSAVTCDGAAVTPPASGGWLSIACGAAGSAHTVILTF